MKGWPWAPITAIAALAIGTGLTVVAIYILVGIGWALLASAVPCFFLASIIFRGLGAK